MNKLIFSIALSLFTLYGFSQDCKHVSESTDKMTGESFKISQFPIGTNFSSGQISYLTFKRSGDKFTIILDISLNRNIEAAVQLDDEILFKPENGDAISFKPTKIVEPVSDVNTAGSQPQIYTNYKIEYEATVEKFQEMSQGGPIVLMRYNIDRAYDKKIGNKKGAKMASAAGCLADNKSK